MGAMVYSVAWVMQDLYHQPYFLTPPALTQGTFHAGSTALADALRRCVYSSEVYDLAARTL